MSTDVDETERLRTVLREIAEKGRAIADGKMLVGGPRAVGLTLAHIAEKGLSQ